MIIIIFYFIFLLQMCFNFNLIKTLFINSEKKKEQNLSGSDGPP